MGDPQWLVYWEILKITWMHLGYPHFRKRPYGESTQKISFGGIPNSRNVLFLQIFLKRAGKPSAGNYQLIFHELNEPDLAWLLQPSPETSPEPC